MTEPDGPVGAAGGYTFPSTKIVPILEMTKKKGEKMKCYFQIYEL